MTAHDNKFLNKHICNGALSIVVEQRLVLQHSNATVRSLILLFFGIGIEFSAGCRAVKFCFSNYITVVYSGGGGRNIKHKWGVHLELNICQVIFQYVIEIDQS